MGMTRFREALRAGVAPGLMHWASRANDMGKGDSSPPPDYTPMAQASKESAEIMSKLGYDQLAETRRQYDLNREISAPVVAAQLGIMDQTKQQGADYYQYLKNFRPLEQAMLAEVSGINSYDMARLNELKDRQVAREQNYFNWNRDAQLAGLQRQYDSALADEAKAAEEANAAEAAKIAATTTPGKEYFISPDGRLVSKDMIQSDIQSRSPYNIGGEGGGFYEYWTEDQYTPFSQQPATTTTPATSSTATAQALKSAEIKKQIEAIKSKEFDPKTANLEPYLRDVLYKTMDGRESKRALEQLERDDVLSRSDILNQEAQDAQDRQILTMARNQLYDRDKANIDEQIGTAIADQRTGYTQAIGQAARQGMRYGMTPAAIASQAGTMGLTQASNTAAAANAARNAGVDSYLQRVGLGRDLRQADFQKNFGLKKSTRDMKIQDDSLSWAKSLDVTGMARGMPGASSGAYSVANQAGSSAVANQMAPSSQLLNGMAQGSATIGSGQQMAMQGLSSILGSQTNLAMNSGGGSDGFGSFLGGAAGIIGAGAKAGWWSDRRMKENIELVGTDESTGLNIYEFNYKADPYHRYRGVMADEVEAVMPEAVTYDDRGFASVTYGMLGIAMEAV